MTDRIINQRIRNRIIEYLELAASFEEQSQYQAAAPYVHIPNEIINQWEDWVHADWREYMTAPTFSHDEVDAIERFHTVWDAVAADTPDPLPSLKILFGTQQWQRLASAAAEASAVFRVRGRLSENEAAAD
ncbi:hypothetical protein [Lysobacter gummosus]|uniref:Uncharacterized protein n=1 Tax=Lysobacter gummosus TaxID=262324 RepID=A0ABY3XIB7_9GAMM|nr:hypothetical protein [Lysobacter gummosus]ALN90951.1 hypothetical protein LG3211_1982 [Lysobacter gummosus]UNP31395.1 hypothetical protein MOV92_09210 [Lysobacter gummosus]